MSNDSLRAHLAYEPRELRFGTSGRRGDVVDLTQLEIYINAYAELGYLFSLPKEQGGIQAGDPFYYAYDLRPSSSKYVPEQGGRGEIAQAIEQAIKDSDLIPVNLGRIPTPALTAYATAQGKGSIMITGSHIPFDRNGYKTNTAKGELRKTDEAPIAEAVAKVREEIYNTPFAESPFDEQGLFKDGSRALAMEDDSAKVAYLKRYRDFFGAETLLGKRILVYQHSAVGRDMIVDMLDSLSATVVPAGRSETFVPIDTENIDDATLANIQKMVDAAKVDGAIDAVVSLDGDSGRPLLCGIEPDGKVRFFGGDLLGMVVADYLHAGAVVVPISCNDAIDRGNLKDKLEPKTKIGSPFVIAGMEKATTAGKTNVCGWEANGGFLTGSDFQKDGHTLTALPTRDAFLPLLCTLFASTERDKSVVDVFAELPARFSRAALLTNFPRETSEKIVKELTPSDGKTDDVIHQEIESVFSPEHGFSPVQKLDYTDGVRIYFTNGDVAHIRPSGNAPELRIYAVADTQERANAIAQYGVAETDGALRQLEKKVSK